VEPAAEILSAAKDLVLRGSVLEGFMADVAQLVEHSLGKGEVTGSIPVISSRVD
jgi:hypothetical protein